MPELSNLAVLGLSQLRPRRLGHSLSQSPLSRVGRVQVDQRSARTVVAHPCHEFPRIRARVGDALAALLVHHALSGPDDAQPIVASFSWDRYILDPQPGPRVPSDFRGLRQMTNRNWEITPDAQLLEGRSSLALLARSTNARFVLLDPANGTEGLHAQLAELAQAVEADSVTVVDVGGDIIAHGDEPGLLSPLADSMTLAALVDLAVPGRVVIAGAGLDGELAEADVWERCIHLGSQQFRLRESDVDPYLTALSQHPSEATTLLAASALGIQCKAEIRDRAALVTVDNHSPVMHIIDVSGAMKINDIARQLVGTNSLDEAEHVVSSIRGKTELAHERRKASTTDRSKPAPGQAELAERCANYRERSIKRGATLLTFRRLSEVIGLYEYDPSLIRSITGADAHPRLALCLV